MTLNHIKNKIGPKVDPCGTPAFNLSQKATTPLYLLGSLNQIAAHKSYWFISKPYTSTHSIMIYRLRKVEETEKWDIIRYIHIIPLCLQKFRIEQLWSYQKWDWFLKGNYYLSHHKPCQCLPQTTEHTNRSKVTWKLGREKLYRLPVNIVVSLFTIFFQFCRL